jgi:predicted  nucleic acid-binding Zn-ribbon protein
VTIDERLDKLTTDLQMLAQVAASHESDLTRLFDGIQELKDLQARNEGKHARTEELMVKVLESINDLGRVALVHEKRITGLEGGRA